MMLMGTSYGEVRLTILGITGRLLDGSGFHVRRQHQQVNAAASLRLFA